MKMKMKWVLWCPLCNKQWRFHPC